MQNQEKNILMHANHFVTHYSSLVKPNKKKTLYYLVTISTSTQMYVQYV